MLTGVSVVWTGVAIALVGGDYAPAYDSVRQIVFSHPEDPRIWEMFCTIVRKYVTATRRKLVVAAVCLTAVVVVA